MFSNCLVCWANAADVMVLSEVGIILVIVPTPRFDDALSAKVLIDLDRQGFATESIHDGKSPEQLSIRKLIGNEVHSPSLVRSFWRKVASPAYYHFMPLGTLGSQLQFFFHVETINEILTYLPAIPSQQR